MNEREKVKFVLKRLIALIAFGSAIAFAVVQITNLIKHDVNIDLTLSEEIIPAISRIEIFAWKSGQSAPSLTVEINFDTSHRLILPIEHKFELRNGRYEFHFLIFGSGKLPFVRTSRTLDVTGPVWVRYQLP